MCLILVFMLSTLILFSCEGNNIDKDKATIEGFMKCLYEVDNYDIIDKAESTYTFLGEGVTEKNTTSEEESFAIIYNGMDKYMTNKYSASGTLISSRISPVRSAFGSTKTGEVTGNVKFEKEDNKWLISNYEETSNTSLNLDKQ